MFSLKDSDHIQILVEISVAGGGVLVPFHHFQCVILKLSTFSPATPLPPRQTVSGP